MQASKMLHPLVSSLRAESRRAVIGWACGIAVVMFAVYMSNGRTIGSGDTMPARYLPHTLLHEGDTDFDEFTHLFEDGVPYYFVRCDGRYVSSYPPMAGILAVPVHVVAHLLPDADSPGSLEVQEKVAAALITALSAAFVFLAAREVCSGPAALTVALVYGLCTSTFSISSQALWQHGPIALFLAVAAFVLLRSRRTGRLWPLGAIVALATLCRPTGAAAVLAFGVYVLCTRWKQLPLYILAGLPFAAFLAWYNLDYGHVLGTYYRLYLAPSEGASGTVGLREMMGFFSDGLWPNLAGHLINPNRGLLIFSPVLLFAANGFWRKVVRERDGAFITMAAACALHLAIVSKSGRGWIGHTFGPRYCADILPFAVLFLIPTAEAVARGRRCVEAVAFVALAVLSLGIHATGAYRKAPYRWNTNPRLEHYRDRLWHWRDGQILSAFRKRPSFIPFDRLAPNTGERMRDREATFGWCKRVEPTTSPVTIAFERKLKVGKDYVLRLHMKAEGSGEVGVFRALAPDGTVLASVPLVAEGNVHTIHVPRVPLTGEERRLTFRFEVVLNGHATVWLDHVAVRRVPGR